MTLCKGQTSAIQSVFDGLINSMAHRFGLKTVAEFVEDEATAKMLAEIGVDYAQGHYYGLPSLPA